MTNLKKTSKLHAQNFRKYGLDLNLNITLMAMSFILLFIIFALIFGEDFVDKIFQLQDYILINFDNSFIMVTNLLIIFAIVIVITPLGKIRLGGKESKPEFKNFSWYSMLFSAGMGIGLIFWAVAEPLYHSSGTPLYSDLSSTSNALATTYFNWGIHAWVIYAVMGLALAFYTYNMNLPLSPRSLFYPIFKNKIFGITGDIIDAFAIIITLFALASSLGLGAMQINSGLNYLFGITISPQVQVIIIIFITFLATLSVISGLNKGVKLLSEYNIKIAFGIAIFLLLLGPTLLIFKETISSLLYYIFDLVQVSASVKDVDTEWTKSWTIFYLAWWISWSIFVGMFIAKISKGRTIREFLLSVILVPTIITVLWFGVFGTTAIFVNNESGGELLNIVNQDVSLSLFAMLNMLIKSKLLLIILEFTSLILVINFFVTSSDSGSLIIDGLANGGKRQTTRNQKILWASIEGLLAIIILILGGSAGLNLIQTILIIVGFPLTILFIYIVFSLLYMLIKEAKNFS